MIPPISQEAGHKKQHTNFTQQVLESATKPMHSLVNCCVKDSVAFSFVPNPLLKTGHTAILLISHPQFCVDMGGEGTGYHTGRQFPGYGSQLTFWQGPQSQGRWPQRTCTRRAASKDTQVWIILGCWAPLFNQGA
eukprot:scaffold75460_cov18-Tisochrysis_lutea.AAC.4